MAVRDSDKLDQILARLDEMDGKVDGLAKTLNVIALRLLAPDECAELGISKKPPKRNPPASGSGSGESSAPVAMAAKSR